MFVIGSFTNIVRNDKKIWENYLLSVEQNQSTRIHWQCVEKKQDIKR